MRLSVMLVNCAVLVAPTVNVNSPPGSGRDAGLASFVTSSEPDSTRMPMLKAMSQLHLDGEPGTVLSAVVQTPPVFCDQLVQFGRFRRPSPSLSWQRTLSTRTPSICGLLAVLMSPQPSLSRLT